MKITSLIPFKKQMTKQFMRFAVHVAKSQLKIPVHGRRHGNSFTVSRDIKSYLGAMTQSPWLAAAMFRKGDAIKSIIPKLEIKDIATGEDADPQHQAVQMIKVKPNRWQTASQFYELTTWHRALAGKAYWHLFPKIGEKAQEMWVWFPHLVKLIPDETGKNVVDRFEYNLGNDQVWKAKPEDMIYLRAAHPTDPLGGLGVVEAGESTLNQFIAMDHSAGMFFRNGLQIGSVFTTKEEMQDPERDSLERHLIQTFAGADQAHKFLILDSGMEYKAAGTTPREAEFSQSRKDNRDAQGALTGTMPIQLGLTEGANRATAWVQRTEYEKRTIQPWVDELVGHINTVLKPFGLFAITPTLVTEDNEEDAKIATAYFDIGMLTRNEGRARFLGMPKVDDPEMDIFYLKSSVIPASEASLESLPSAAPSNPTPPKVPEPKMNSHERVVRVSKRLQQKLFRFYIRQRQLAERRGKIAVRRIFREQEASVLRKFRAATGARSFINLKGEARQIANDIFAPIEAAAKWATEMNGFWSETIQSAQKTTAEIFDVTIAVDLRPGVPAFEEAIAGMGEGALGIQGNTQKRLANVIEKGAQLGLNPTQIANGDPSIGYKGIRGVFKSMSKSRAQLIARHDSARALDRGNAEVFQNLGVLKADVVGCEDDVIMPDQEYGCSSEDVPMSDAAKIEFHPNHLGAVVPSLGDLGRMVLKGIHRGVGERLDRHQMLWYKQTNEIRKQGKK